MDRSREAGELPDGPRGWEAVCDLLCCPSTRQPLHAVPGASDPRLPQLEGVDAWLLTEDATLAYPVMEGIPRLCPEDGVKL